MNKSLKLTKVSQYRKSGTGSNNVAFAVSGHPDVVKEYIADKTAELGFCPMVDGTNQPRHTANAGLFPASTYELRKNASGKWSIIDNSDAATLKDLLSAERDPIVKAELAKMYAAERLKEAKASRSVTPVAAAENVAEEVTEEKL